MSRSTKKSASIFRHSSYIVANLNKKECSDIEDAWSATGNK